MISLLNYPSTQEVTRFWLRAQKYVQMYEHLLQPWEVRKIEEDIQEGMEEKVPCLIGMINAYRCAYHNKEIPRHVVAFLCQYIRKWYGQGRNSVFVEDLLVGAR